MSQYHVEWGRREARRVGPWLIRLLVLMLIGAGSMQLWQKNARVAELRAQATSASYGAGRDVAALPVVDAEVGKRVEEVMRQSRRLTLPINEWLQCVAPPEGSGLSVVDMNLDQQQGVAHLTMKVASAADLRRYLEAKESKAAGCKVDIVQEESSALGGHTVALTVELRHG